LCCEFSKGDGIEKCYLIVDRPIPMSIQTMTMEAIDVTLTRQRLERTHDINSHSTLDEESLTQH